MGMFDWFYCDKLMPDGFQLKYPEGEKVPARLWEIDPKARYQTKCMDCNLDVYGLSPEGQLLVERSTSRGVAEVCDYTGTIEIDTGIPEENKPRNKYIASVPEPTAAIPVSSYVEYELVFNQGQLAAINMYY